jgi:hypothetical protein
MSNSTTGTPSVPVKGTKAVVAALGATLTALMAWLSAVAVYAEDDRIDLGEVAPIIGLTISLVGTVYGVWKVTNRPVTDPETL